MLIRKQSQDRKRSAATIGCWASILTAALNVWYVIAFGLYQPVLLAPWPRLAAYAASFQALPLLAWVEPCFVLAPVFLTMMTCLHVWTREGLLGPPTKFTTVRLSPLNNPLKKSFQSG